MPQFLLRGFAADCSPQKAARVWWFRRDAIPVLASTRDVFVERDFYGKPKTLLDADLTKRESDLAPFVREIRSREATGGSVDPGRAAQLVTEMAVRSRWLRVRADETLGVAVNRLTTEVSAPGGALQILRRQIRSDPTWFPEFLQEKSEQILGRKLTAHEQAQLRDAALLIACNLEQFEHLIDLSPLRQLFGDLSAKGHQIVKRGHIEGLERLLGNATPWEFLVNYEWNAVDAPASDLVLGDCGPLFVGRPSGRWTPVGVLKGDERAGVALPLSSSVLLYGSLKPGGPAPKPVEINQASAEWSGDGFVASSNTSREQALQARIGAELDGFMATLEPRGLGRVTWLAQSVAYESAGPGHRK